MNLTWLVVLEVLYVVPLATWIVLEKRHPLATIAWILSLALLPVAGFPIYYLLGPRRLRRKKSRRALALNRIGASLPDLRALTDPSLGIVHEKLDVRRRQLIGLALNNSQAPLSTGNQARLLRNGSACYEAIERALQEARHHVHFQSYIFEPDQVGSRFRDLLVERAKAGVEVRLLVDAVGSAALAPRFLQPLQRAGAELGVFNRVSFARFRPANFRNHRKIVVVDGEVGFTGGLNVGDEYLGRARAAGAWRDTHLELRGPAVRGLQRIFVEDWNFATGHTVTAPAYFPERTGEGGELVQIVGSGPDRDWQAIQQLFFAAIASAQERVLLTTAYFVPDEPTLCALVTAALRGVDVQLLLPRHTDSLTARAAGRSYFDELLRAGVRLFEYLPGMLHAKTLVVDRAFCAVGSANFDQRSFRLNFEVSALIYGETVADQLATVFDQDLTVSREITPEEREARGFGQRLTEAAARVFSPLL